MSNIDNLLVRLDRVKRTKPGHWTARCPAHDDRGPSLAIRELDDGRILIHCFAECDVHSVLAAVDLKIDDLFPDRVTHHGKPERRPFPAADCLRAIGFEAMIVSAAAVAVADGKPVSEVDRERLLRAASRIQAALTAGGLDHG